MPVSSSLTVKKALQLVIDHCKQLKDRDLSSEVIPIREAYGRILAESVYLDTDQPPFDRSMRDGYAILSEDIQELPARLKCLGEVKAGEVSSLCLKKGEALQIMTGAPVPAGADGSSTAPVGGHIPGGVKLLECLRLLPVDRRAASGSRAGE